MMTTSANEITSAFLAALSRLTDAGDFVGMGNLMLEILMKEGDESPGPRAEALRQNTRTIVAKRFSIDPGRQYGMPHRDEHLRSELRGCWKWDVFPQIVILAYTIGATWRTLPPPHNSFVPYYLLMAERQRDILERLPKAKPTKAESIEKKVRRVMRSELPPEVKEEEIVALFRGKGKGKKRKHRTIDPD